MTLPIRLSACVALFLAAVAAPLAAQDAAPRLELLGHKSVALGVAFSPDGKTLASVCGGPKGKADVRLWNVATGKQLVVLTGHEGPLYHVRFSPDGKLVASAGSGATVRVWDAATGEQRHALRAHTTHVDAIAFHQDGRTLATAGQDGAVHLWDTTTGQETAALAGPSRALAFSPDGKTLARGSGSTVRLWDVAAKKDGATFRGVVGEVLTLDFSPDGKTVATGGLYRENAAGMSDSAIERWEVATGRPLPPLRGHDGSVLTVAFCKTGASMVSTGHDQTARVWDAETGRHVIVARGSVRGAAISPDGKTLATCGPGPAVRLWDVPGRK
jgi:WD40 repeat protein